MYLKIIFLISKPNVSCEYSKELSQWDRSFQPPKHMFKLMGEIILFFGKTCVKRPLKNRQNKDLNCKW